VVGHNVTILDVFHFVGARLLFSTFVWARLNRKRWLCLILHVTVDLTTATLIETNLVSVSKLEIIAILRSLLGQNLLLLALISRI